MDHLHDDPKLLARLREAAQKPLTSQERRSQKASFITGLTSDNITRAQVEEYLQKHEQMA